MASTRVGRRSRAVSEGESPSEKVDRRQVMAWWRTHPRHVIAEFGGVMRDELVPWTRGLVEDRVINRTMLGEAACAAAALATASRLREIGAERDLVMSWLALGGIGGEPLAARMVYDALMDAAADWAGEGQAEEALRHLELALDWQAASGAWAYQLRRLLDQEGRRTFRRAIEAMTPDAGRTTARGRGPGREGGGTGADGASLVVVREIGDPTSREGKDAVARYRRLTEPLTLAGQRLDPDVLSRALLMEFPWFAAPIEAILHDLRLLRMAGVPWFRFRPILLLGPPGSGKTRFARRLGRLAGTGCELISAAGSSDSRMLAGTARGWSSGQPAFPLLAMMRAGTANPVLVVDEIDKATSGGHNGDMRATLLTMLEPQTAAAWPDEFLLAPCDVSQASWVLTANELGAIPAPLLSRVRLVRVGGPRPEHFDSVLHGILGDLAEELMVPLGMLPELEPEAIAYLRARFRQGTNVRRLKAALTAAVSRSAATPGRRVLN